jgi:riboflavin kinase
MSNIKKDIKKTIVFNGIIVSGLGEGTFFMSMQYYKNEIKDKLGFNAYPGTLNLKVRKEYIDLLKNKLPIRIDVFKSNNKTFGGVSCYKAKIKNVNGSIIIPDLTKHKNIIEFIAPVHLKSKLKLKDGDKLTIKLISPSVK